MPLFVLLGKKELSTEKIIKIKLMKKSGVIMKNNAKNVTLHKLKVVAGCALIGSVLTGTFFGWIAFPFDLHIIGASVGAAVGVFQSHLV